jgi:hypothetical protein
MILRTPLLLHLAAHLLTSYLTGSMLYFTRSVIFLQGVEQADRVRWFASVHSCSAVVTLMLQLFATGMVPTLHHQKNLAYIPESIAPLQDLWCISSPYRCDRQGAAAFDNDSIPC